MLCQLQSMANWRPVIRNVRDDYECRFVIQEIVQRHGVAEFLSPGLMLSRTWIPASRDPDLAEPISDCFDSVEV